MALLELITSVIEFIKTAGGLIKPKGKLKEIATKPEFQQEFLNQGQNNIILNVGGDLYLGDLSKISVPVRKELFNGFKISSSEKIKKDVNFFDNGFYQRVLKFSHTDILDKKLSVCSSYIKSVPLRNLFQLSIYVKILFDNHNSTEANAIRADIGKHYGKDGRKFCNLYLQKYIHLLVEHLIMRFGEETDSFKAVFESELKNFLEHSETIFFIHPKSDKRRIISTCLSAINHNEEYIALHSGNELNNAIARAILSQISKLAIEKGYDIKEENSLSTSKTHLLNIYITKKAS
jgi:hypothetical protein